MAPSEMIDSFCCKISTKRYESFADLPILLKAEMQRDIDEKQVSELRTYIRKSCQKNNGDDAGPPLGVITFGKYNGSYYTIDGQHRLAAIKAEFNESKHSMFVDTITYECKSYDDLVKVFRLINKNKKVPDYILNAEDKALTKLLKQIQKSTKEYPFFGDDTKHKKRPYIYSPTFMDALSSSKFVINNKITTVEQFKTIFSRMNDHYKQKLSDPQFIKYHKISEPMRKRCIAEKLFISLVPCSDWCDHIF
jgi:hypothetical protein